MHESPEFVEGASTWDERTDIYSLGMLLSEMLTGRMPFDLPADASLTEKIMAIIDERHRTYCFPAGLDRKVQFVIMKAVARKAEERFQSVGEFIDALEGSETAVVADLQESRQEGDLFVRYVKKPAPAPPEQKPAGPGFWAICREETLKAVWLLLPPLLVVALRRLGILRFPGEAEVLPFLLYWAGLFAGRKMRSKQRRGKDDI